MLYSHLSKMNDFLSMSELDRLESYFLTLSPKGKEYISLSKIITQCQMNEEKTVKVVQILKDNGLLIQRFALRCPECGLLLFTDNNLEKLRLEDAYCYGCEKEIRFNPSDVEVIYSLNMNHCFFIKRQPKPIVNSTDKSTAGIDARDSLVYAEQNNLMNKNILTGLMIG